MNEPKPYQRVTDNQRQTAAVHISDHACRHLKQEYRCFQDRSHQDELDWIEASFLNPVHSGHGGPRHECHIPPRNHSKIYGNRPRLTITGQTLTPTFKENFLEGNHHIWCCHINRDCLQHFEEPDVEAFLREFQHRPQLRLRPTF